MLALTGKRGGYEAMLPLFRLLQNSSKFDLKLIVTDQHLMPQFGFTADKMDINTALISVGIFALVLSIFFAIRFRDIRSLD